MIDKNRRDTRLDLAKAIAISLVLVWHLRPFQINLSSDSHFALYLLKFGLDQFYFQVTLLAVPLFFLVSSYLFFERMGENLIAYSKKRVLRIFWLYLFWSAVQFVFFYANRLFGILRGGEANFSLPGPVTKLIMQGGPGLPYVGGSIYYFLFVLLVVILLSVFFGLLRETKFASILGVVIILASLVHFEIGGNIPYWRVDNFLIYVPIAFFLWKDRKDKKVIIVPILFLLYALFSLHDLYLRQAGYAFEGYSRISIALGASALFSSILLIPDLKRSNTVDFLSRYSLGIFATHKFWQLLVITGWMAVMPSLPASPLDLAELVISIVVITLTVLFLYLVRKTALSKVIR